MALKKNLTVLRKRAEFLAVAATNRKWVAPGVIVQLGTARQTDTPSPPLSGPRYGLTATRKIGNAVIRNRARRRLRALAFDILPQHASPQHDYVLIARASTATRAHAELKQDMITALKKLNVWREK